MEMLQQVPRIFTGITHVVTELHVSLAHNLFICPKLRFSVLVYCVRDSGRPVYYNKMEKKTHTHTHTHTHTIQI